MREGVGGEAVGVSHSLQEDICKLGELADDSRDEFLSGPLGAELLDGC